MIRFCLPIACLITLFCVSDASAQRAQRTPGYARGNTISPYFNLFRGNGGGGVGNYFTLVRPIQNQLQFNQRQFAIDQRFQRQLSMNQTNLLGPETMGQAFGPSSMLRPGSQGFGQPTPAASFFNYSHYYGTPNTGPPLGIGPRTR